MACILEVSGHLPDKLTDNKVYLNEFTQSEYYVKDAKQDETYWQTPDRQKRLSPGSKEKTNFLYNELKNSRELTDFVKQCLILDPDKRLKPMDALEHPFLNLKKDKLNFVLNQIEQLPKSYLINHKTCVASQWMKQLSIS